MTKRIPLFLAATMMAASLFLPATAQSARASAKVDLDVRFREVQTDAQLAEHLFKIGRKVAAVCANCHGVSAA